MRPLRYSRQREEIYQYLLASKEHPSAEMIYQDLRRHMANLSLATVYRNLRVLEEMGQVRRVNTPQSVERYDADCHAHPHFICSVCGRVMDLPTQLLQAVEGTGELESCQVQWVSLSFGGVCAQCMHRQNHAKKGQNQQDKQKEQQ